MADQPKEQLLVRVPSELKDWLNRWALLTGRPLHQVVSEAIREHRELHKDSYEMKVLLNRD